MARFGNPSGSGGKRKDKHPSKRDGAPSKDLELGSKQPLTSQLVNARVNHALKNAKLSADNDELNDAGVAFALGISKARVQAVIEAQGHRLYDRAVRSAMHRDAALDAVIDGVADYDVGAAALADLLGKNVLNISDKAYNAIVVHLELGIQGEAVSAVQEVYDENGEEVDE